jgi:hypothetical protein
MVDGLGMLLSLPQSPHLYLSDEEVAWVKFCGSFQSGISRSIFPIWQPEALPRQGWLLPLTYQFLLALQLYLAGLADLNTNLSIGHQPLCLRNSPWEEKRQNQISKACWGWAHCLLTNSSSSSCKTLPPLGTNNTTHQHELWVSAPGKRSLWYYQASPQVYKLSSRFDSPLVLCVPPGSQEKSTLVVKRK